MKPTKPRAAAALAALLAVLGGPASAASSAQDACPRIDDDARRLACYDRAAGRQARGAPSVPPAAAAEPSPLPVAPATPSPLSQAWQLDAADKRGTFELLPYKLNYVLPLRTTSSVNNLPTSPNPNNQLSTPLNSQATEAKFQISVKLKAWQGIFGDNGDLWFGYTQQSNWQLYNSTDSRPFRETDYAPEVMLAFRTDVELLGWRWRLFNLGLLHQSNGRAEPLSRSWNRVYAQFGLERGNLTLQLQPWYRLKEDPSSDDNPDIQDYLGWGSVRLSYEHDGFAYSALGRYSFSGRRGGLELDWAFPLMGALKGYVQLTTGYGESLIDYNHAQTTIGIGVLLFPW